jgi:type IV pilus assembly protein PilY1
MIDRNIITYTIDVDPTTNGQGPGWTKLLKSMAIETSRYAAVNSTTGSGQEIADAVNKALSEIQAVNSVFASVSLPLSVNTQGTYLNQVYVGMFRPEASALPRWAGNLKQYKLGFVGDDLRLQDATGTQAINALTGFVTECARSFWTPATADSYWAFNPQGTCIPEATTRKSNSPDGNIVEKGAQAYVTRSASSRLLKTCSATFGSCTTLTDFTTTNSAITQAALGATDTTERTSLIDWARGVDLADENRNGDTSEIRASVHGDVVHSRPVAINLGTESEPQVLVFYGGNDGVFRAINGNRPEDGAVAGIAPGGEVWGFLPPEFYGHIKRLRDNTMQVSFPNITHSATAPKPYGIDGAISAHRTSDGAWIYATMRRGGRALYAFNVNANDPANVSLKWKKGCPTNLAANSAADDVGCTSGFSAMGQTWSQPKIVRASGYSGGNAPLLVMGGGYDPCEDGDPNTCTSPKGNRVLVLDADTGDVVRTFTTDRSVIAEAAVVQDTASGTALYVYAVDLGGNVYRLDMGTQAAADWDFTKIASLGCDSTSGCSHNRKFMFAPDVLLDNGSYVLMLGSGDREKPRNYSDTTNNYFFALRDRPTDTTWLSSETAACGSSLLCMSSLYPIAGSANPTAAQLATKKGWYLALNGTEQVVTSAITIFGTVTFSTHEPRLPRAGTCQSDLGIARVYNVNYVNAASENGTTERSESLPSTIGLPPSPVAGVVRLDDGESVPFCIGCRAESPLEGEQPEVPATSAPTQPKSRVYWYIQR